jgi:glutamate racemase
MNIGFFDSGLGGLLILKAVAKALPHYDYLYYGDTANLPYGDKTEEQIYELTRIAVEELFKKDCLLVIIACNTASSETLRKLQDTYLKENYPDRRILGVIVPTVEELLEAGFLKATLLATTRTVESKKYEKELKKHERHNDVTLRSIAMPGLVQLIESGDIETATQTVTNVLDTKVGEREAVLLGCTHYTLLKDDLRKRYGHALTFIAQDEVIPKKLATYLAQHPEIETKLSSTGKREITLTEHRPDYDRLTAEFLGGTYLVD